MVDIASFPRKKQQKTKHNNKHGLFVALLFPVSGEVLTVVSTVLINWVGLIGVNLYYRPFLCRGTLHKIVVVEWRFFSCTRALPNIPTNWRLCLFKGRIPNTPKILIYFVLPSIMVEF